MDSYKSKYLKYKNKYLEMNKIHSGGVVGDVYNYTIGRVPQRVFYTKQDSRLHIFWSSTH